ncbi:MAG: transglycosylase SLT domain-containing protein [Mariprofundaceae bacterium]|nr:transglycosylase SLT domain-containing protein [Mariprofundaceae bacterium]
MNIHKMLHKVLAWMGCWVFLISILILPCVANPTNIQNIRLEQQRIMFQQARDALKVKDMSRLQQLSHDLGDYPLAPYLDVWQAYEKIKQEQDYDVWQILNKHKNLPESKYLRIAWMQSLAKRGQWPQVAEQLSLLGNKKKSFADISILSDWYNGHPQAALQSLTKQWRQAQPLPTEAQQLVKAWHSAGHPSHDDVWVRVQTWAKHGQWKKLQSLKHHLDVHEQKWLDVWQQVKKSPEHSLLSSKVYHIPPHIMAWVANDGLRQLARDQIERAWLLLGRIAPQLKPQDVSHLKRYLAIRAAKQHHALAKEWLSSLPQSIQNKETRAWFVRMLLLDKQWKKALDAMQSMPESEQIQSRWLYWQGYVLEQLHQAKTAKLLFQQAALERGYYSFLSANHLHQAYQMGAKSMPDMDMTWLLNKQAIQRAHEWRYWGEHSKADAEWNAALKGASKHHWAEAMQLAMQWGWYEQVIRAASKSGQWDMLDARFPLGYEAEVIKSASKTKLKPSMIWSIIRQESAFNPNAKSRTGASGLMQLMPATAKDVVKKHRIQYRHGLDLSRPKHNIELGSLYIADMLKRFNGQQALAIAAYNAGPNRVANWKESMPMTQEALWVELIPFNETRRYVQHVLAFMVVYDWLQQQQAT